MDEALGWFSKARLVGKQDYPEFQLPGIPLAKVIALAGPESDLYACFLIVHDLSSGKQYLHTAFPAAISSQSQSIFVDSVEQASYGLEGRITVSLGGAALIFFDPFYCLHRDAYRANTNLQVKLSAIAYSVKPAAKGGGLTYQGENVSLDGAAILMRANRGAKRDDADAYGLAYIEGFHADPGPDDYTFYGCIQQIEDLSAQPIPSFRFRVTVLRVGENYDQEIDLEIYAIRERILTSGIPNVGDDITGLLWLQGTLSYS